MRRTAIIAAAVALAMLAARPAIALEWVRLERAVAEPAFFDGLARLELHVTAVNLHGKRIQIHGDGAWRLRAGTRELDAPYLAGTYLGAGGELALALVVHTGFDYGEDLADIKRELTAFVEKLPGTTQVAVIGYGDSLAGGHRVKPASRAGGEIDGLTADSGPGDPRLLEAIERAIRAVRKAEPSTEGAPLRRVVLVISDGKDLDAEPEDYTRIGKDAARDTNAREPVAIFSMAYSPIDNRRPLLGLGELSKRSGGTFRWVRSRAGFGQALEDAAVELTQQYVLTFFVAPDDILGKRLAVGFKDLRSEPLRVTELGCGEATCGDGQWCTGTACVTRNRDGGRGVLGWILLVLGVGVALLAALLAVGFVLTRRQEKRRAADALAHAVAEAQAQQQPSHRIVPQGPQGGLVQAPAAAPPAHAPAAAPPAQAPAAAPPAQAPHTGAHPAAPAATSHAPGPQSAAPHLFVVNGPLAGQRFPLHHGFTIGKAAGCHLLIDQDGFASGHHAQIHVDAGGGCTVVDIGSTNGTFVNGVRAQQMRLSHGMLIRCGQTDIRFMTR